MKYNINNYYTRTKCVFKGCNKPNREPDYVSGSGSLYWYGRDKKGSYVIRSSDHWSLLTNKFGKLIYSYVNCGSIASCFWKLKTTSEEKLVGKAYFKDFSENNKLM